MVDDYTFKVKFLRADKLTMPSLAIVVPSIYNSELCKKNATASDPWALEWTKNNCAGSGAYKVESFKSSEQVVLARFDGWKGGTPPKFQRAMYRNVAAAGTRRALVEKGDADLSPDLPPREIADISATKKFRVDSAPMANTLKYLALSTITKPFDDVRVRQAVAYGIPYQKVIDSAVFGRAQPMFGASAAAPTDASWPQPFPYTHDPDKAKALLRDAGLRSGFETKLFFDAQVATTDEPAALVIQDELGKLGIKISIEKLPDFPARRNQKNWPMAIDLFGAWFDDPDFFFRWIWHGQNTVWNLASYKNPEMDRLLDAARQEREGAAYASLVKQFVKLAMTDVPVIPLYQPTAGGGVAGRHQGLRLHVPSAGRRHHALSGLGATAARRVRSDGAAACDDPPAARAGVAGAVRCGRRLLRADAAVAWRSRGLLRGRGADAGGHCRSAQDAAAGSAAVAAVRRLSGRPAARQSRPLAGDRTARAAGPVDAVSGHA